MHKTPHRSWAPSWSRSHLAHELTHHHIMLKCFASDTADENNICNLPARKHLKCVFLQSNFICYFHEYLGRTPTNFSFLLAWAPTCAIPSFVTSKRGDTVASKRGDTVGIKMTVRLYPQCRPLIIWGRSTVCNGLFRKYFVDNMWMVNCERLMPSKCRPHIKNVDIWYIPI